MTNILKRAQAEEEFENRLPWGVIDFDQGSPVEPGLLKDLGGVYILLRRGSDGAFMRDPNFIYIGETGRLGNRIYQHRLLIRFLPIMFVFTEADPPERQRLERLLIATIPCMNSGKNTAREVQMKKGWSVLNLITEGFEESISELAPA